MGKSVRNHYQPELVSPPGETLLETIEALGLTRAILAERTGLPLMAIHQIIKGKAAITPEIAMQLEQVVGVPAHFWANREAHYRALSFQRGEWSGADQP